MTKNETISLIIDLKAMLYIYAEGKDTHESYAQAMSTIINANAWIKEMLDESEQDEVRSDLSCVYW